MNLILFAIPVFLLFIAVEWLWSRKTRRPVFKFRDSATNLACGMGSQVFGLLLIIIPLSAYMLVYNHARIYTFDPQTAAAWVVALIGVDFCYYWFHRCSHEMNGLWSFHVVHHQSEEYNLTVALRQSWFSSFFVWAFYVPLAVIGIPFELYAASYGINLLYQFFVHTKAVGRLGPLEWLLNTPSHHRVHHGRDREYLDRNYAGILIIWDRLFGTFINEDNEPTYGILKGFPTQSAVAANVVPVVGLVRAVVNASTAREKCGVLFKHPGWQPGDRTKGEAVTRALLEPHRSYQFGRWTRQDSMAFGLTALAIAATVIFMALAPSGSLMHRLGLAAGIIVLISAQAVLFTSKKSRP